MAAPPGWRWQLHARLPSTQDAAIEAAHAGEPGHLAILAGEQDAGRGSRGRQWTSPPGNLHISILLRPATGHQEPGRWALLAGLALHQALSPHAPGLLLKWPNDLLLGAGKLAGILIDSQWEAGKASWVVIGIGANLAHAPTIADRPAACLPGPAPTPVSVAARILSEIDLWRACDMTAIGQAWLARAHPLGTLLDVRAPQRRIAGAFAGLSPRGELLLEGCEAPISSAEIWPAQGAQPAAATGMPG